MSIIPLFVSLSVWPNITFFAYQNLKTLTFEMFWSSLNGSSFTPWKPVACHKCHDQEKNTQQARCVVNVGKIYFTLVYIFQSSEPPRHYWPPPKLAPWPMWNTILLNMIWFFLKPCWSSPQPKASQASLATLEGSRKSCRRFHETCDLLQFLIRRPKSINKSIEHGDFQQCHPTSSFKALCSR